VSLFALLLAAWLPGPPAVPADVPETLVLRGKALTLHLYGPRAGEPTVVASGDGGWVHLGPEVAALLAGQGRFVVGLDSKEYLSRFTSGARTLTPADVPADFAAVVERAREGRQARVLLVGVSEGAALGVLAAADPALQPKLLGLVALGLPDEAELGWRWRDALIYLTRKTPDEPVFHTADYVARLGPVPLAALHSTHDEFVPLAEVQRVMAVPGGVKRLWVIEAQNHRFTGASDEFHARLDEALQWIRQTR
jgi:hypothetical protein